jgi:hypothetical protein
VFEAAEIIGFLALMWAAVCLMKLMGFPGKEREDGA